MALDEDPNAPGTYWTELAQVQQAGTFKKCQCGEHNPGSYDTCHFCQRPLPDREPAQSAGTVFTPTIDDMEAVYGGVLVASLAEGEEAVAVTGDKREALEAIDTYYREVCGQPNLLDDANARLTDAYYYLDSGHAVFTRSGTGGWEITPSSPTAPGAVAVTWFRGVPVGPVPEPYARRDEPKIW
ncbi:hypothetical protein [Streptomyces bluensis]|uniref:RanBP2-type domain-containing protein n=1 Tax=Streptomyces bluensis TaxID=33897 RepID=A0ABW6UXY4_9ACTN